MKGRQEGKLMANVTLLEIKGSDRLLDVSAMGVGAGQSEIL